MFDWITATGTVLTLAWLGLILGIGLFIISGWGEDK